MYCNYFLIVNFEEWNCFTLLCYFMYIFSWFLVVFQENFSLCFINACARIIFFKETTIVSICLLSHIDFTTDKKSIGNILKEGYSHYYTSPQNIKIMFSFLISFWFYYVWNCFLISINICIRTDIIFWKLQYYFSVKCITLMKSGN